MPANSSIQQNQSNEFHSIQLIQLIQSNLFDWFNFIADWIENSWLIVEWWMKAASIYVNQTSSLAPLNIQFGFIQFQLTFWRERLKLMNQQQTELFNWALMNEELIQLAGAPFWLVILIQFPAQFKLICCCSLIEFMP